MSDARFTILNMLAEKKITVEEAERLLKALEPKSESKGLANILKEIGQSLQNIPHSEAAQVMNDAFEHVKNTVSSVGSILDGTDQDQEFQIAPGTDLKIHHGGGNLLLHTVDEDKLVLSGARRGCSMDAAKNRVVINSGGSNLAVGIPRNVETLDVSAGGGNVSVRGLPLQHLHAKSAGGNLTLEGIHASQLKLSSMGGHLTLKQIKTIALEARSIGGNIHVEMQPEEDSAIDLHSVGGHVELKLPENSSFKVKADTLGGRFSSDFQLQDYQSRGGRSEGRVGEGKITIRLRTKGGDARIRKSPASE